MRVIDMDNQEWCTNGVDHYDRINLITERLRELKNENELIIINLMNSATTHPSSEIYIEHRSRGLVFHSKIKNAVRTILLSDKIDKVINNFNTFIQDKHVILEMAGII